MKLNHLSDLRIELAKGCSIVVEDRSGNLLRGLKGAEREGILHLDGVDTTLLASIFAAICHFILILALLCITTRSLSDVTRLCLKALSHIEQWGKGMLISLLMGLWIEFNILRLLNKSLSSE
jgi:hypothetical protein